MNLSALVALASSLALAAQTQHPTVRCDETPPPAPKVDASRVQSSLNDLLAAEGLGASRSGVAVVRPVDLDGDASTLEVLVDVLSPEHCVGAVCETLVVRACAGGQLWAIGHGKMLLPLGSRSGGWMDLSESAFPGLPVGTVRFSAGRYR